MKKVIVIGTILILLLIMYITFNKNIIVIRRIKSIFKEINIIYRDLFKEKSVLFRWFGGIFIFLAEILVVMGAFSAVTRHINLYANSIMNQMLQVVIIIISFIAIHFSIGYILLITHRVNKFIYNLEDTTLKMDLILSYFITSSYVAILIMFPDKFKEAYGVGFVGVGLSYILNLRILVKLISNLKEIKNREDQIMSFREIMIASIFMVIMIVINLFLAVCLINSIETEAYSRNPTNFDLFYYTVISFTTVGYGDIVPLTVDAKIMSMIIAITSVGCISIFLSTILSFRDKVGRRKK